MRVGVIYDSLFPFDTGGGERVYRAMADRMVAAGHEVIYITVERSGADYSSLPFDVVEISQARLYDSVGARTSSGALGFARAIMCYLSRRRNIFDLLVVSALPVTTLLAARLATFGTTTVIVGDWLEVWPWRKWRDYSGPITGTVAAALQWLGARASAFNTVNSVFTADRLRSLRATSNPFVLGLLDMSSEVSGGHVAGEPDLPPVALFVGRLIADKRVDALPGAISHARRQIPELRLSIVGTGEERGAIEQALRAVDGDAFTSMLGRVDDQTLDRLMSGAAVLVNPSAREGFGMVVGESAARGVPIVVVAGEDNAAEQLIVPGVNGFVAANASASILGDAIASAVLAGRPLRESTADWFARERESNSFGASVKWILDRGRTSGPTSRD